MAVTIQNANRCQSDKNWAEWFERSEGADPGTADSKRQQHKRADAAYLLMLPQPKVFQQLKGRFLFGQTFSDQTASLS